MDYNIYTLGDIDFVWSAFTGIALIFSKYTGVKEFMTTAAVLSAVNLFYRTWLWLLNPQKTELPVFSWFLGLILFMMAVTRVDVTIESVKSGEVRNVDGIPIFIAATATVTTNLSQGLLKDYKKAFDPLAPVNLSSTTLDDDLTLGPMIKFMKFLQWGGDSQGYCSLFPEAVANTGNLNACASIQSVAYNCLKTTQNSVANIAGKETVFNTIFSANIGDTMDAITQAVNTGVVNASANVVGANGVKSMRCKEAWAAIKTVLGSPKSMETMRKIAQVNGIISPDQASGIDGETGFTDVMASANGMYGKSVLAHDAMTNLFILNEMKGGADKYRTPLGISSDMQMFEASMKRTNNMASQGQLWMKLSGAAISFLEMFAYMVAPFALLMLLALGGNGVAAAAKYLQLIVFVNIWPLTAVMVNAYVKKVISADLDTWSTMNSDNNVVTWMGIPGLAETYSSYLSVASALYALIPVLTLFLMTQSIHPMMNATKGVTPDAPINNSHMTPQVWDAPNSGKSSFGDRGITSLTSTGQGTLDGGSVSAEVRHGLGNWQLGSGTSDSQGQSAVRTASQMNASQQSFNAGFSTMSETGQSGSSSTQFSKSLQQMKQLSDQVGSSVAKSIASKYGLQESDVSKYISSATYNAGLKGAMGKGGINLGLSSGGGKTDEHTATLNSDIQKAVNSTLSSNTSLADQIANSSSSISSNSFSKTDAFKEGFSQTSQATQSMGNTLSSAVSTEGKVASHAGIESMQSINLAALSDTMKNTNFTDNDVRNFARKNGLDENAFMDKFQEYNSMFKSSNQLGDKVQRADALVSTIRDVSDQKVAIETGKGETAESNKKDLAQTAGMLQSLQTDFGANAQILNPLVKQLDKLSGESSSSGYINQVGEVANQPVDTSGVMTPGAINELGQSVTDQSRAGINFNKSESTRDVPASGSGASAKDLTNESGRAMVNKHHEEGQANNFNESQREIANKLPTIAPAQTIGSAETVREGSRDTTNLKKTIDDINRSTGGDTPASFSSAKVEKLNDTFKTSSPRGLSQDTGAYTDRILNDPKMSDADKRVELAQQGVFTYTASTMSGGAEGQQLKADSQKILDGLQSLGVNWEQGDLKAMGKPFTEGRGNSGSLESVVKSNLNYSGGDKGGAPVSTRTSTEDYLAGEAIMKNLPKDSLTDKITDVNLNVGRSISSALDSIGAGAVTNLMTGANVIQSPASSAVNAAIPSNMPDSISGKALTFMQMSDAVGAIDGRYKDLSPTASQRYEQQGNSALNGIKQQLSDSPHYGPTKANEFAEFAKNNLTNSNEPYQARMDKTSEWLNNNKVN
jgi:conjugal transfer mating pair stabilization protein TraG